MHAGLRKFLRNHGTHIVLLVILLPIIGTFLAGIGVFLSGMIAGARIENVGKSQSCMVIRLPGHPADGLAKPVVT